MALTCNQANYGRVYVLFDIPALHARKLSNLCQSLVLTQQHLMIPFLLPVSDQGAGASQSDERHAKRGKGCG